MRTVGKNNAGQVVELPYGDRNFSLVIILPAITFGPRLAVEKIIGEDWANVRDSMTPSLIELQLPKCSLKYDLSLKSTVQDMGIKEVFSPSKACLDRLMKQLPGAYITDVLQAATIDVSEEGVEAAAATAAPSGTRGGGGRRRPAGKKWKGENSWVDTFSAIRCTVTNKTTENQKLWDSNISRLLTSSLSLGVPVPRATQCM